MYREVGEGVGGGKWYMNVKRKENYVHLWKTIFFFWHWQSPAPVPWGTLLPPQTPHTTLLQQQPFCSKNDCFLTYILFFLLHAWHTDYTGFYFDFSFFFLVTYYFILPSRCILADLLVLFYSRQKGVEVTIFISRSDDLEPGDNP